MGDCGKSVMEKTGETTSPDRLVRFNGVHGRAGRERSRRDSAARSIRPAGLVKEVSVRSA
jgi:hypothetical protein